MGEVYNAYTANAEPVLVQRWKETVTVAAGATTATATAPFAAPGTVVACWIKPVTLTAAAVIKVYEGDDGLATPEYAVDYTVPNPAVETHDALDKRIRVMSRLTVSVTGATAGDSFEIVVEVDPNADTGVALGTAGTPSADVLSVQGVSGGTPQPVSGPLTDTELRATDLPVTLPANTLATVNATIANGASLSGVVDIGEGKTLCAIDMPADWTAANLTFQASTASDGTFDNLYDQYGTEKTVTADEDRYIALDDPAFWLGVRYIKVRSGTAASAVNQGAERVITLVTKPV